MHHPLIASHKVNKPTTSTARNTKEPDLLAPIRPAHRVTVQTRPTVQHRIDRDKLAGLEP